MRSSQHRGNLREPVASSWLHGKETPGAPLMRRPPDNFQAARTQHLYATPRHLLSAILSRLKRSWREICLLSLSSSNSNRLCYSFMSGRKRLAGPSLSPCRCVF